jgi:hypothetical protein
MVLDREHDELTDGELDLVAAGKKAQEEARELVREKERAAGGFWGTKGGGGASALS